LRGPSKFNDGCRSSGSAALKVGPRLLDRGEVGNAIDDWGFPASPPPAADLIAPLYPGATYDKECSAAKSLEAKGKAKWRQVWCYVANEPKGTVGKAFDMELTSASKRGVQVDLIEVSRTPPVTQIQYWLTAAPPQAAATAPPQPAPQPSQQPAPSQEVPAPPGSAPAPPPSGSAPTAGEAIDTVNKLRGLFGR
jgi:hypothetical protein